MFLAILKIRLAEGKGYTMGIIGIIGAMDSEVELLTEQMEDKAVLRLAGMKFYYGLLEKKPAVVAKCGIGKVCAAMCAQAMKDKFHVEALINTGVAGGLHPDLQIGDLVIGTQAVQHDFDLTSFGYAKGYMEGEKTDQPTRYASDDRLIAAFKAAADEVLEDSKYLEGTIASGDVFVADETLKRELRDRYDAAAAEMEGAAIAQVAQANAVPCVIVRAISDLAGEKASVSFTEFEKAAAQTSARIVLGMLRRFEEREETV